jgi:hypothetical protein
MSLALIAIGDYSVAVGSDAGSSRAAALELIR